ncbi:MAG: hypothetical protein ACRCYD_07630 [Plesiomonas sp.]
MILATRYTARFVMDFLFVAGIALVLTGNQNYTMYVENAVYFLGVVTLVTALYGVLTLKKSIERGVEDPFEPVKLPQWFVIYRGFATCLLRVLPCALMGWYIPAVGLGLIALISHVEYREVQKLRSAK